MHIISPNFKEMGEPNIEIKAFPDGDGYIRIPKITDAAGEEVFLFQRLYPNQNTSILNTILILDVLRRVGAKTTLVVPYLPYSRQDKLFLEGEALSAQIICDLFANAGVNKLITLDCHFMKKEGEKSYSKLNILNISANKLLIEHARSKFGDSNFEIISPDQGANYLVSGYGGKSMAKVRGDYSDGKEVHREVGSLQRQFDVTDKNILVLDDMISTGGTMIKAVENLRRGGAKKIICAATHGFFLKDSLEKLNLISDSVFTTNSILNSVSEVDITNLLKKHCEI